MFEQKTLQQVQQVEARLVQWIPIVFAWLIVCIVCICGVVIAINRPLNQQAMTARSPDFFVDINKDGVGELILLPGVGKTIAQRIVDFRQNQGPFTSVEQLRHIAGISHKTLNRFRDFLRTLEDDTQQTLPSNAVP